ncbi:hypothetical protein P171DRAFT_446392 [Karstenula rhodostoma CBS 690.94]|uniref:Arrestin-like N-terminal domain-containing protein n=1 Tax=Karstenula rhodostoma CBS 690.94 TaxID=1392251 RepID=A0A9P4U7R2_9PLEO|nr:hypothetical protein P171DRAFT_446392 [Karstenula rhodostoma CBS 690.94]
MNVSIELDHPNVTFTNGDTIYGRVVVYCPNTTIVVSKITASLTGETKSFMIDTTGLFMNHREEEKHCIVKESQVLLPNWNRGDNTRVESLKLGFGYHRFEFALKLPWFPECPTCPPNSPIFNDGIRNFGPSRLPPSMENLASGADSSYRIDVAVTTYKNMFKSTTRKSTRIAVWPSDTSPESTSGIPPQSFPSTTSAVASILAPPDTPTTLNAGNTMQLLPARSEPTRIIITAKFPQDFHISTGSARNIAMRLTTKRLNNSRHSLYLSSFQLLLFGYTDILAGSASRGQMSCWTLQSLSNLDRELPLDDDPDIECDIDPALWREKCVPETAVPTFDACNMGRRYEVEILLGLQCRHAGKTGRVSVVQLRVPVRIGSGLVSGRRLEAVEPAAAQNRLGTQRESVPRQMSSMNGFVEKEEFPAPPTYEEAMKEPSER